MTKAIDCHYPTNAPQTRPRDRLNDGASPGQREIVPPLVDPPSIEVRQEPNNSRDAFLDTGLVMPNPDFANLGVEPLDFDVPDLDFADFLIPQANGETVQDPSTSSSSSLVCHSTPSTNLQHARLSVSPSLNVRSLTQRPKIKTASKRTVNLILHTLKSYPLMMLRDNTLPPFIHPCSISSNAENNCMEPLTNCISLVHMISSGVRGSRKLFWRNVRVECEHLSEGYERLDRWGLLAAMQALSIYVLIRVDEGETVDNDFDFLLITTVIIIAKQLRDTYQTSNTESALYDYSLESSWKDWIFEESSRRICVVYRVVNLLVYFEPAALCEMQTDLILAPLPAKKQLWEAGDGYAWRAETERDPAAQIAFGLAADGELVKLDEGPLCCSDAIMLHKPLEHRETGNWDQWCSGMDGFGALVMLTASLIG
ncbi:hypothetical protein LTR10_021251 [Elasticomyces elasticus]|uniref:Transcription factor domain-containing protein n=1 Tax=Exophiala sideris TaxID=1016849 RepID=A0ABR0JG78_9EURO|nr:hypothetical protein LTR10_021251 [Elasticomyces elasticus]KAK5025364.1 hypothetical protein LTS07_008215 [Exophiala sideris]KAK5032939.1 hypothetical protein LTR13_006904 [Exophiala sideris]KAK5063424.1 hypothetical protein LTR69_004130 [Exophiala sideris]KAK5180743.1 hypothetical protein LTR44_007057 [Eurotiomycetes sp. CCFEE 6388]